MSLHVSKTHYKLIPYSHKAIDKYASRRRENPNC
jgi:hypothetical protein